MRSVQANCETAQIAIETPSTEQAEQAQSSTDHQGATISACIVCRNDADRLGLCLDSVTWVDEIVVMDLSSTDESVAVAKAHGAKVVVHEPYPVVEPLRNEIAAIAHGDWILVLDPDEQLSAGLPQILRLLAQRSDLNGVVIPRMNFDLGHAPGSLLHRYEPQLRMYRRSKVSWPTIIHMQPQVPAEYTHRLPQRDEFVILHDRHRTIAEVAERIMRYAPNQAQSMLDEGQVFTVRRMIAALGFVAYKQFVLGKAWQDGMPGLTRATMMVGHRFYVWAAFWQISGARRTTEDDRLVRRIGYVIDTVLRSAHSIVTVYHGGRRIYSKLLSLFGQGNRSENPSRRH